MELNFMDMLPVVLSGMWEMRVLYFWIFGIVFLVLVFRILEDLLSRRSKIKWLLGKKKIQELQKLTPTQFEEYIAILFKSLGYSTRVIGGKNDGGIDVEAEKDGQVHYIQCKKYITSKVPVGAVRDFYGAIADRIDSGKGYFVTTNVFTLEAERFAKDKPIELVDKFKLMEYVKMVDTPTPVVATSVCSKCGSDLVRKTGKYGPFIGCSTYPKCDYAEKII